MPRPKSRPPEYHPRRVCKTQRARILKTFDLGDSLSSAALRNRFRCANPSATIAMMRKMGWNIRTVKENGCTKYRIYTFQPVPDKYIREDVGA